MSTPRHERRASCTLCGNSLFVKDWPNLRAVRCPMLLTCGHTACRQCLESYANLNQQVTCRQCNTVVVLSSRTDVDKVFPVNYYVLGKMLYKEAMQKQSHSRSSRSGVTYIPAGATLAPSHSRPALAVRPLAHTPNTVCFECSVHDAVYRCEQCDTVYCHGCFAKVHSSGKALRAHTRINLSDEPANSFMLGPCVTHPEVNYRFYCEEDTVLVCPLCAVLNHNGHTLLEMSAKNMTLLPQVQEATLALMKVSKELERSRKGLRQLSPGAESEQLIQMRHEVATHFSSLHGFLQMNEDRLALQLDVGKISCYDDIETMTQEVGDQVRNMQKLLKMAQTALEPDMLSKMDFIKLMSELRDAVSLPCKLTLPDTKVLDVKFEIATNVLPILENHCTLNMTAPPPPMLMSLLPEEIEKLDDSETSEDSEVTSTLVDNNNPFIAALERKQTSPLVSISHNNTKNSPHSSQSLPSPHSSVSSDSPASPRRVVVAPKQNKPADWSVGTSELIRLSHVINPSNFYVQRVADDPKLEQLLRDLELVAPTCKPFNIPKIGNLCIVQYSRDGRWYRGRIKSIIAGDGTGSLCDVFYIDYGNMEQVPLHRVLELPKHLCEFQPLCRHCVLNGIVARYVEWSDEAIRVFVEITTRPKLQLTVAGFSGNSLKVDLIILSNDLVGSSYEPTSVRDILLFLDHGCLIAGETFSSMAKVMKPTRKFANSHFNLTAGTSLQVIVTHIDSPMCFYIQRVEKHSEGLGNMMRALNEHYRTPDKKYNVYYPQIGMCCVAKYEEDGNWYRAMVTGLPDKKMVSVQYVDYGNSEVVSWENVKKLHEKFFLIDAQAVKCQLYDLKLPGDTQVWDEDACIKFHTLCYNKKLRMVVNARNNMDLMVSLYERVGKEEHSVAVAMAQAGFGMCSRKSAQATVQKRANTGTHKDPHSKQLFMGPQPPRNKVGRGNYTPYMEVQPCLRPDPSSPVAASLAPSMLQLQTRQLSQPREPELRKEVQVISHNSPGEIYIRISSLVPQLEIMIEAMQTYFKNPPVEVEEKEWRKDEYCAVKRHIHPQWCRAVISEKLSEYIVKVFLIDHAMEMEVCMADLYVLPGEFSRLLHGAIRCHMTGIKAAGDSNKWPILARERLGDLLVQYDAVFMTKTGPIVNNSIPVELWVEEVVESGALEPIVKKWACLNQMLVERGVAIPVKSEEVLPVIPDSNQMLEELIKYTQDRYNVPCTSADVPQRSVRFAPAAEPKRKGLPEEPMVVDITEDSEDAPVIITEEKPMFYAQWVEPELPKRLTFTALATYVDYSGYFYLQELPKSEKALAKLQRMVDHHYRDSVPAPEDMLWSVGQICVAKYHVDNKWYRAKVIEILDADCNHLRVQFVDFGNTETVSVIDLRKAAFVTSVPVQCIKCKFHGLIPLAKDNEWTTFDLDIIHGSIVDKKCAVVLAELPSPRQVVKVCGLVTDLGRDVFKFLVEQEIAERGLVASSPTLSEVSDSESIFSEQEEPMQVSIESVQTDTAPPHSASTTNSQEEAENEGMQVVENKTETIQSNETETEQNADVSMKDDQSETVQDSDMVEKEQDRELAETVQEVNVTETVQDKDMTESEQDRDVTETGQNTEQVAAEEEEEAICVILSVESTGPEEEEAKTEGDNTKKSDAKESQVVCISSDDDNSNDSVSIYKYKLDPCGKFVPLTFEENSLMLVDITVVVSAVEIYIKPASLEDSDPLNMLMEEITREASKQPPLNSIEIGQACCAQYMSQFFRVLVVNINPDCLTAIVNFVDYGNNEELPLSDLRVIRDSWMQLPRQALHCMVSDMEILPDVDENVLDTETSAALLSGQIYAKILSKEEPCKVQLLKQDQTTSVYEEMLEKKLVKMTES